MAQRPKSLTSRCPFCGGELSVQGLSCKGCQTRIETDLSIPPFFRLPADLQGFVLTFLKCRGNIREVEKTLGISYPTVCKRLDLVNELLGNSAPRVDRGAVLEQLERGELSAKEAVELLRKS